MKIKTDEITSVIKQEIEQFSSELEISQVGRVVEVGDGIARIYGLSRAMAGELIEFDTPEGAVMGQIMNLELDTVGAVIYGNYLAIQEGATVKSTGRLLEVPVGDSLLGRVARWYLFYFCAAAIMLSALPARNHSICSAVYECSTLTVSRAPASAAAMVNAPV